MLVVCFIFFFSFICTNVYASFTSVQSGSVLATMLVKHPEKAEQTLDYLARAQRMQDVFALMSLPVKTVEQVDKKRLYDQCIEELSTHHKKLKN